MTDNNSTETRKVYHKQHQRILDDEVTYSRLRYINSEEFFALGKDFFKGKTVLDAGCGNTIMLSLQFIDFGSEKVYAFDIGEEWIKDAEKVIERFNINRDMIHLSSGNVLAIEFPDEKFDLVACNGVLPHLQDKKSVEQAFSELGRVCKKGGEMYIGYAIGKNSGLLEGAVIPAIRDWYQKNEEFRDFVDNIEPDDFKSIYDAIASDMLTYTGETAVPFNSELFDVDLCVMIQNLIQCPSRTGTLFTLEELENLFHVNGFENIRRLNRYVTRKNIRKYLAPLHYDKQHKHHISKILYGDGYIELIATKQ